MGVCTPCIYVHKIYAQSNQINYLNIMRKEHMEKQKMEKGTEIETKTGNWKMETELLKTELETEMKT